MLGSIDSPNFSANTLALDPDDSKIVYVPGTTYNGTSVFMVSTDAGEHWQKRFTFDRHRDFNQLVFFNSMLFLSSVEDGVMISSDKGKSWKALNGGLQNLITARFANFHDTLYLVGGRLQHNVRDGGDLYRLSRDGLSWKKVDGLSRVTGIGVAGDTLFVGTWEGNPKLWSSTDGTTFAQAASRGLPPDWIGEIVRLGTKIYVGAGGNGIYVSSNSAEDFTEFNRDLVSIATREVFVNPHDENDIYVGTWDRLGFYWSRNSGKTYGRIATEYSVLALQPDPNDFRTVYIGGDRFAVGHVTKSGSTFVEKVRPGRNDAAFIKSLAIDPHDGNHILAGVASQVAELPPGEGVWETRDQGEHWMRSAGVPDFAAYSIIFNSADSNIVYASALGAGVFKSTDGGSHFTQVGGSPLAYTYRLALSPRDPNVLVASSNVFFGDRTTEEQISGKYGGIFQSRDGGTTWKELTAGIRHYDGGATETDFSPWLYNFGHLPNYEMVLIDPENPDHLVIGHHGENVIVTNNGGATWEKYDAEGMVPGGVHNYAYCLGSSSNFKKVYACTCGRGLFRGLLKENGGITWDMVNTAYAQNDAGVTLPRNAREAEQFILSGQYNHEH